MYKLLQLTKGHVCKVSPQDFPFLSGVSWHASKSKTHWYARGDPGTGLVYMHVHLLKPPEGILVDHIDHDTLNNTRENLRLATVTQNNAHTKLQRETGFRGVHFEKRTSKWRVECGNQTVGRFDDQIKAAEAYDHAARVKYGVFAVLNFPQPGEEGCAITAL